MGRPKQEPSDAQLKRATGTFREEKKEAKRAAKELEYPDSVITKLNQAKSVMEITKIMTAARLSR